MQQGARFEGFAFGFKIGPDGTAEPLPHGLNDGTDKFWVWIALDPAVPASREWLLTGAGLDGPVVHALLAHDTRPRCLVSTEGALLILRGVNVDPKSEPTDLVSIRAWIEDNRVITVQHRKLATVDALRASYDGGSGPNSSAELIVALADGMIARMRTVVHEFEAEIDRLEDMSMAGNLRQVRARLNKVRHNIVPLRRYLSPQRDAFASLMNTRLGWLDDWWQSHLREITDEVHRYIEALDAVRESANIVQDTLNARIAEQTNRMIALLSFGAAAFLPLNLFVGLLGANVAGIPGAQSPYAFWIVVGLLVAIVALEVAIFRRMRLWRLTR
jgi:zinc transporter